ncbi:radical SAM protein [Kitasatospora cheerisanensis]|uniref:Radical SAM protein n=1 Tax=Kitasatospora cheerisanensis KCTC 2395 TaxID=1348663 RepID=A0A066ZAH5_9ACTN|nr:radical SAM/SPASM domain-containing protein [Kitasatospora cheerisanensis]KDN87145.1 radical SAM protein [Kitasatospora cheerisanensis KCTC 2395]
MELSEIVDLRPEPAAGLLVALTRRCPLACAHCSTASSMDSPDHPDGTRRTQLLRFVRSFTPAQRPEAVLLTGGEPLLLPGLAHELTRAAQAAGSRVALLSGLFFARDGGPVPATILRAITALDHFSASLDAPHEREVPRAAVFRVLAQVLDAGVPVSLHLTGTGPEDPYLAEATDAVLREFGARVPMLVNEVRPVGRATGLLPTAVGPDRAFAPGPGGPCAMAAWPVIAPDGTVVACCNQRAVDRRPVPPHLRLGHLAEDDWPTVRRRTLDSPRLRLIRTLGPDRLRARHGTEPAPGGYCGGCHALPDRPGADDLAAAGPAGRLLDQLTAARRRAEGPAALLRHHGCAPYAHLVRPGAAT